MRQQPWRSGKAWPPCGRNMALQTSTCQPQDHGRRTSPRHSHWTERRRLLSTYRLCFACACNFMWDVFQSVRLLKKCKQTETTTPVMLPRSQCDMSSVVPVHRWNNAWQPYNDVCFILRFTSRVRRVGGKRAMVAQVAQDCFVSPTNPPLKQNTPLGGNRKVNADQPWKCNHVFFWVMPPISQLVRNVNFESPGLRREKNWMERESPNFCAVNPCVLMFAIYDVLDLWCVYFETSTCASTNNVRRRRMAYTYEMHIFIYNKICIRRCMYKNGSGWQCFTERVLVVLHFWLASCQTVKCCFGFERSFKL